MLVFHLMEIKAKYW